MPNMRSRARDDMASVDEVKVYDDEGEESPASSENLSEDKIGLVIETEKRKGLNSGGDEDAQRSRSSPGDRCRLPELPSALQDSLFRPYQSSSSHTGLNGLSHSRLGFEVYSHGNTRLPLPSPVHLPGLSRSTLYGLPHASPLLPLYSPNLKDYQKWADVAGYPLHLPFPPLPGASMSTFNPSGFMAHPSLQPEFAGASGAQYSHHPEHERNVHQLPGMFDSSRQPFYFSHHLSGHNDRDAIPSARSPVKKKPVIKKPLNAFMLFMREMRPKVIEEESIKESAAINQILGRRWHALSQAEQTKYYEMAKKEKELHAKMYPGWSARDNYAINSKRKRKHDQFSSSFLESQREKHSRLSFDEEMWYNPEQSDNDKQSMLSSSSVRSANDCDI